jgi:uncharacterized damage-inducible protein DinB
MSNQSRIRRLLLEQLSGKNAHVDFQRAVEDLELKDVGRKPESFPHTIWELVEHIRIAQHDIVAFSQSADYTSPSWPEGYWPSSEKPESQIQWDKSLAAVKNGQQIMIKMINNDEKDVLEPIPHGDGQTLFREAMLIVDHNSYHIGQIVQMRRVMGIW